MSNTTARFAGIAAFTALSLAACGSPATSPVSAPAPPPSYRVCLGPETPDDLEDLIDVDVVRHEDFPCSVARQGFAWATLTYLPAVGESPDAETVRAHRVRVSAARSTPRAVPTTAPVSPTAVPGRGTAPTVAPTPAPRSPASTAPPVRPAPRAQAPAPAPRLAPAPAPRPAPSRPR